jgi:hypothetical protein
MHHLVSPHDLYGEIGEMGLYLVAIVKRSMPPRAGVTMRRRASQKAVGAFT